MDYLKSQSALKPYSVRFLSPCSTGTIVNCARSIVFGLTLGMASGMNAYAGNHYSMAATSVAPHATSLAISSELESISSPLTQSISRLYQLRNYQLIWSNGDTFNENAKQLVTLIEDVDRFGLNADDYNIKLLRTLIQEETVNTALFAKSDITFSHALIKLASHVTHGKLANEHAFSNHGLTILATLNNAANNQSISSAIDQLLSQKSHYTQLLQAISLYKNIQENIDPAEEPILLTERSYEEGDYSKQIPALRKRLQLLGDYTQENLNSEIYDQSLANAVYRFQLRHGLHADGIFGKQTAYELNVPIWKRIHQLEINLMRAQSLPNMANGRHLFINIPAYQLYMIEDQKITYQSNVVVGKRKHATPQLSSELTRIVLSPYWNVPKSIIYNEIIPALRQDPAYLAKNNMRLIATGDHQGGFINPASIDWYNVEQSDLRFRIRQEPGIGNSLGQIKFFFPNPYSVYLHDTPSKHLFTLPQRAFSHGCIRLEDPFGLAEAITASEFGWSKQDLVQMTQQSHSKTLSLKQPIPIHITYLTAWANEQGIVNFRPDIYRRDGQLIANLYNAD